MHYNGNSYTKIRAICMPIFTNKWILLSALSMSGHKSNILTCHHLGLRSPHIDHQTNMKVSQLYQYMLICKCKVD